MAKVERRAGPGINNSQNFFAVMELMVVSRRPKASAAADTGLKEL